MKKIKKLNKNNNVKANNIKAYACGCSGGCPPTSDDGGMRWHTRM